jgi:hypothetical protein
MNFPKDLSPLLHAITVSSPGGFYGKPCSTLVLTLYTKKPRNIKLESIHEYHFVEQKNEGRKPDKNWRLRRLYFMPRNHD